MLKYLYVGLAISNSLLFTFTVNIKLAVANSLPKKCQAEFVSISRTGKVTTEITFINQRVAPVKTYWLDYSGKRKFYSTIMPNDKVVQSTYVTHPWVVTDQNDNCLGVYYPDGQPRVVEIP